MRHPQVEQLLDHAGLLIQARNYAGAAPLLDQARVLDPKNRRGLMFGAIIAAETGHRDLALKLGNDALRLDPNSTDVIHNTAAIFYRCGQPRRACQLWERQIELQPNSLEARWNLVIYHQTQEDVDLAEKYLREILKLDPAHPHIHVNLGSLVQGSGRIDEAVSLFREGARLHPADILPSSNYLFSLHLHPGYGPDQIWNEHAAWARGFESGIACPDRHGNDTAPDRRLRVGYVSPYFRNHVVGHNLLPLLRHHDHAQFEIYCYSDSTKLDDFTAKLREKADVWRETAGKSDAELAELVARDQIDILVDLALHSEGVRLGMFARKPAPVQVTWMGYPGSTGLTRMDYRMTDPVLDPPGETDHLYSEKSIRLDSFWCFAPPTDSPGVGPLPAERNGFVTFGSLNNFIKIHDGVLELWREVLAAVPCSRLALLAPKGKIRECVREKLQVDVGRLVFLPRTTRAGYFDYYNRIDLGLDPFPYTGHTTTQDSLWMGVPVVTLTGPTLASRGSLSILTNLGLTELAVRDKKDYVTLAVVLAQDLPRLRELRAGLRDRMRKSVLMDAPRFALQAEAAFRVMWQKWCAAATAGTV